MSALQTNINTLMSANSVEELRNRLVAILTTIAETPAGSGITAVTSDDGSIDIDNTNPSAPDLSIVDYAIPLSGTTQMGAAEITHTSTGKTDTIGFVDGSVYMVSTGAAGNGELGTSSETTYLQYNAAVSGYSSTVACTDSIINFSVNGDILALEFEGSNNKIGFFDKTSATSAQASAIVDATNATDVITQLNTLLAAMRAYGLIAE